MATAAVAVGTEVKKNEKPNENAVFKAELAAALAVLNEDIERIGRTQNPSLADVLWWAIGRAKNPFRADVSAAQLKLHVGDYDRVVKRLHRAHRDQTQSLYVMARANLTKD